MIMCSHISPEYGKLSGHCLSTACRCPQQHIGVRVVQGVENLGLHWVEVGETVELLIAGIIEGGHREGVEVKKLGVWWMYLGQYQVLEGNSFHCLRMQPAIGENPN